MSPQFRVAEVGLAILFALWAGLVVLPALAAIFRATIVLAKRQIKLAGEVLEPEFPPPPTEPGPTPGEVLPTDQPGSAESADGERTDDVPSGSPRTAEWL